MIYQILKCHENPIPNKKRPTSLFFKIIAIFLFLFAIKNPHWKILTLYQNGKLLNILCLFFFFSVTKETRLCFEISFLFFFLYIYILVVCRISRQSPPVILEYIFPLFGIELNSIVHLYRTVPYGTISVKLQLQLKL